MNTLRMYILDAAGEPIAADSMAVWGNWMATHFKERVVQQEIFRDRHGMEISLSTVFLGVNHSFRDIGPAILWETMVFGGKFDKMATRCSGPRSAAQAMHDKCRTTLLSHPEMQPCLP